MKIQKKYYDNLIKKYKNSRKIAGWGSKSSQEKRFQILTKNLEKNSKFKLLDVGCGRGDLLSYIKKKKYKKIIYTGLDLNNNLIKIAKKKHKNKNFIFGDFINKRIKNYDVIFVSGLLNLKVKNHSSWLRKIIKRGIFKSNKLFIFNILSTYAPFKENRFFYADPLNLSKFIKKFTKKYIIDHTYFDHDFSIIIYK